MRIYTQFFSNKKSGFFSLVVLVSALTGYGSDRGQAASRAALQNSIAVHAIDPDPIAPSKVVAAYYPEWAVYGRKFGVEQIPFDKLTHLLYAFLPICGPNASLQSANPSGWSILQHECQGKSDYEVTIHDRNAALGTANNNFGKLAEAKLKHPQLKILASIGGWTLSDPFHYLVKSPATRAVFIQSVTRFLTEYPFFDGVDLDWEYPGGGGANSSLGAITDGADFIALISELRLALNALEVQNHKTYLATAAVGSAPAKISQINYAELFVNQKRPLLDLVFAMTYDYYGAWSGVRGHQAGLYANDSVIYDGFYGEATIKKLLSAGVPAQNLVLGVAMYGRAWQNVQTSGSNPLSLSASDDSATAWALETGMWEPGILDYKFIINRYRHDSGFSRLFDTKAKAPLLWSPSLRKLISYEDTCSTRFKREFAQKQGLAGLFAWEIDADNGEILQAMNDGAALENCPE